MRSCPSPLIASNLINSQAGFSSIFSHLTSKSRLWLSDDIFANHLTLKSQHTCIQTRRWWNMLPPSFYCRQGSTGDETVFNSNNNWNLRVKSLVGIFVNHLNKWCWQWWKHDELGTTVVPGKPCHARLVHFPSCISLLAHRCLEKSQWRSYSSKRVYFQLHSSCLMLLFSITTELTEHHTPKSTDDNSFSWSFLYVPM